MLLGADRELPGSGNAEALLRACVAHWHGWAERTGYRCRWRECVTRLALALKLLTAAEHGSIAAAATFGLPEAFSGRRNRDARAAWIWNAS